MKKIFLFFIILAFTISFTIGLSSGQGFTYTNGQNGKISMFLNESSNVTMISTTNVTIYYVEIDSQYPGQPQMLTIPVNGSGFYMYPYWTFRFFSDAGPGNLTSFSIYVNGLLMKSGSFSFTTSYSANMSFSMVNVSIVLSSAKGVSIWNYHMIPILHTSLANYYKSTLVEKPVYTVTQYIELGAKILAASLLILLATYYTLIKTYIKKKEVTPFQLLKWGIYMKKMDIEFTLTDLDRNKGAILTIRFFVYDWAIIKSLTKLLDDPSNIIYGITDDAIVLMLKRKLRNLKRENEYSKYEYEYISKLGTFLINIDAYNEEELAEEKNKFPTSPVIKIEKKDDDDE